MWRRINVATCLSGAVRANQSGQADARANLLSSVFGAVIEEATFRPSRYFSEAGL